MAVEVATAYVSLQASTKDLDKSIRTGLDASVKHADTAGQKMGQKLASAVGGHMEKSGTKSGDAFAKGFAPKVQGAGTTAMSGLAQAMLGGAEGIGSQAGGRFSAGLTAAISRGADGAVAALGKLGSGGWSTGLVTAGTVAAGGVALVGTAAVVALGELYKLGSEWDGIADGITFKTGLIGDSLDAVKDSVKNVAAETAASVGDIANISAALIKGLKIPPGGELESLTQKIAQFNAAAQENGAEPLNIREFIKAMKQMKMDGDVGAMSSMLDDLYKVTQNTTIPMNDLVTNLKLLGPAADQFNIPVSGLVQILAALDGAGVDSKNAIVGLKTAWSKLGDDPNPAQALRSKLEEIRNLLNSTSEDARIAGEKMATEFFGNKAGPQLAQAIKDGNLELDNFNTKAANTGLTIGEMTQNTEDLSQEWTKFKNFLTNELEPAATAVFGGLNTLIQGTLGVAAQNIKDIQAAWNWLTNSSQGGNIATGDPLTPGIPAAPGILGGAAGTAPGIGGVLGGGGNAASSILGGAAGANAGIGIGGGGGVLGTAGRGFFNSRAAATQLDKQMQPLTKAFVKQKAAEFGLVVTSENRNSKDWHGAGRALDLSNGTGNTPQMEAFARYFATNYGSQLLELIYSSTTFSSTIKNGNPLTYDAATQAQHRNHVHLAFNDGGGVSGPGTSTSDSIPAWLSDGEHVLTAADVAALGGHSGVYAFRSALHRSRGGPITQAQIPWPPEKPGKAGPEAGARPDLKPGSGYPGVIGLPQWGTPGTKFGPPPPGWWDRPINPDDVLFPEWMPPGEREWWLDQWGQNRNKWKPLGYATGGAVGESEEERKKREQEQQQLPDEPHLGTGKLPGPEVEPEDTQMGDTLQRVKGYLPAAANTGGVAGTSSLAGFLNMGNQVVSGLIDTGVSAAQTAVSMGITAGTMGGSAAAGPIAGQLAGYGIQLAGTQAKRLASYGFQMGAIGADALVAQLFPFGAPRWIGYDYTQFVPQLNISQIGTTTVEKAMQSLQNQQQGKPVDPNQNPGGPVNPQTLPGQQGVGQPVPQFGTTSAAPITAGPQTGPVGTGPAPGPAPADMAPMQAPTTSPASPAPDQQTPMDPLKNLFGFDQGGWLEPGQLGINMTGRPEPVLTPQQWDALAVGAPQQSGGPLVKIDAIYGMSPEDVANQIEQKQRLASMRFTGRPYK